MIKAAAKTARAANMSCSHSAAGDQPDDQLLDGLFVWKRTAAVIRRSGGSLFENESKELKSNSRLLAPKKQQLVPSRWYRHSKLRPCKVVAKNGTIYLRQRMRYMFLPVFVCLSVCLLARLLKNACMDLDEMLRVDRRRDMDELINF